jgi:hypothetical protein
MLEKLGGTRPGIEKEGDLSVNGREYRKSVEEDETGRAEGVGTYII